MPSIWVVSRAGKVGDPTQSVWVSKNLALAEATRLVEIDLERYRNLGDEVRERRTIQRGVWRVEVQRRGDDGTAWQNMRTYYAHEFEVQGSAVDALGLVNDA